MPHFLDKNSLRTAKLVERKAIDTKTAASASHELAKRLLTIIPKTPRIVAGYCAIRGEIDVLPALKILAQNGHTLCLPVVITSQKLLQFSKWHPDDSLIKGTYDIDVPHEKADIVTPDIVIVPLVAFDKAGHRLGYGAGHYDATIKALRARNKDVRIIGAAYSMQMVQKIPAEAHDEMLDAVVTEKAVMECR